MPRLDADARRSSRIALAASVKELSIHAVGGRCVTDHCFPGVLRSAFSAQMQRRGNKVDRRVLQHPMLSCELFRGVIRCRNRPFAGLGARAARIRVSLASGGLAAAASEEPCAVQGQRDRLRAGERAQRFQRRVGFIEPMNVDKIVVMVPQRLEGSPRPPGAWKDSFDHAREDEVCCRRSRIRGYMGLSDRSRALPGLSENQRSHSIPRALMPWKKSTDDGFDPAQFTMLVYQGRLSCGALPGVPIPLRMLVELMQMFRRKRFHVANDFCRIAGHDRPGGTSLETTAQPRLQSHSGQW